MSITTSFGISFTHPAGARKLHRYEATVIENREPRSVGFTAPDDTAAVIKAAELLAQEPDEIAEVAGLQRRYF